MKTFMLRATALVVLALVGCGDADPSGPGTEGRYATFTPDRSTYVPFRVARLELDGPAPGPGASVSGTIGGRAVELTATSDSAVVVVVPAVSAGSHALSFAVSGREYRGSITVTSAAGMTDPVGYLDAVSEQARTTIAAMRADAEADGGPEHEAVLELLRIAEDSLAVFEARRASLSAGDAGVVAQALRANLTDVPEFTGPIGTGMSALQIPECSNLAPLFEYECTWDYFIEAAAFTGGFAALSAAAAKSIVVTGPIGFVVSAGSATLGLLTGARAAEIGFEVVLWEGAMAYKAGTEVVAASTEWFNTRFFTSSGDPFEADMQSMATGSAGTASLTRLTNGRTVTFTFSPRVRNVQPSDRDVPVEWLARGLQLIDAYNQFIGRFTTRAQIELPEATFAWLAPVPSEQIDIEIVANDKVRVDTMAGTGDRVSVRFATDEDTEQAFTYDVIYSSVVYPPVRVRYEAVLEPPTYQLAWRNHSPVPDSMALHARVDYPLLLLDEDGAPVARDWATEGITLANGTNPDVTAQWDHNGEDFVVSFEVSGGQLHASTEIDVLLDGRVIQHLKLALTDSVSFYESIVIGGWTRESYYRGEELSLSEQWTLLADGTAISSAPREGTWGVSASFDGDQLITDQSVPTYSLGVSLDRVYHVPLSYPLEPHEEEYWVSFPTNTWYLVVITKN